jgi:hypothetical protein
VVDDRGQAGGHGLASMTSRDVLFSGPGNPEHSKHPRNNVPYSRKN